MGIEDNDIHNHVNLLLSTLVHSSNALLLQDGQQLRPYYDHKSTLARRPLDDDILQDTVGPCLPIFNDMWKTGIQYPLTSLTKVLISL